MSSPSPPPSARPPGVPLLGALPGHSTAGPRGDHPRDVIPGPSAGDSLAAGNIDLPDEVANDELDDLSDGFIIFGKQRKQL